MIRSHVVLELQDVDNADVAMLGCVAPLVPEDTIVPVVSHDIVGKLMVQCSREAPHLSKCFGALLCFDGSECYFSEWDAGEGHHDDGLTGKTFGDALYCFAEAAVFGIRFADPSNAEAKKINPKERPVMLNPPRDYVLQLGDKVLVLAEDNDTYEYGPSNHPLKTPVPPWVQPPPDPEKVLLCGWRRDFDDLLTELDQWLAPGSSLTLFNGFEEKEMKRTLAQGGMAPPTNITEICYVTGDPCSAIQIGRLGPAKLEGEAEDDRLHASKYRIEEFDSIMMLSEEGRAGGMSADSRVMVSMLVMRHISDQRVEQRSGKERLLVTEIRDPRTQSLMSLTKASDAVVGNEIVAMILAQVSEDKDLMYVMEDLFSEEGMEMHVKDIRLFVEGNEAVTWWDLIGRCTQRNMLPIGWVRYADFDTENGEAVLPLLNPDADRKNESLVWHGSDFQGDQLVVIALD